MNDIMTSDSRAELKARAFAAIDDAREQIVALGETLWQHPELGYKEFHATKAVSDALGALGLNVETPLAITGCRARAEGRNPGPRIAMLGELDAILCPEHAAADPATGAVHACGHHIQTAVMYGVAAGLMNSGIMNELDGAVDFFAVPAEECIEIGFRSRLRAEGKIRYFGGKQELIRRGYFNDVNISVMFHPLDCGDHAAEYGSCGNGYISKAVTFIGKEAHAGANPDQGINALNAATLAISAVHANRETFREADTVRIHPILTKGGDIVNNVPAEVSMESMVRARTLESIADASHKFNRAMRAGALAVGGEVRIEETMGYLPLVYHDALTQYFIRNVAPLVGEENVVRGPDHSGSSDIGDLSHIMPTIHPSMGGIRGALHTRNFSLPDPELAYITSAKTFAGLIIDLLADGAQGACEVLATDKAPLTIEQYLELLESNSRELHYRDDA